MLLLAHAAFPGEIEAATVDHRLRPDSAGEAALVARLCAERGIPHAVLAVTVPPGNVQDQARHARYAALEAWMEARRLCALLTAHHMDDQAETLLMRLNRGSGVRGLAGVRARTRVPGGRHLLLRPLLGWRRGELAQVVLASGVRAADDPSNHDPRFDRVRVRQALAEAPWLDVAGLARSAALLAAAEEAVAVAIEREWTECVVTACGPLGPSADYAPHRSGLMADSLICLGVLEKAADVLGCTLGAGEAARMAAVLASGQSANFGGMAGRPARAGDETVWRFTRENPRASSRSVRK